MKTITLLLVLFLPLMQETDEKQKAIKIAENLLEYYISSEYEKIIPLLDETMKQLLTVEKIKEVKQSLNAQVGVYERNSEAKVFTHRDLIVVDILCHFKHADLLSRTFVNKEGLVSGWRFLPQQ